MRFRIKQGPIAATLLAVAFASPAFAQDIRGLEVCTAEKQMERRTSCLQSNIEFLQQALDKSQREARAKLAASDSEIAGLKARLAKIDADLAALKSRPVDAKPASSTPADTKPAAKP